MKTLTTLLASSLFVLALCATSTAQLEKTVVTKAQSTKQVLEEFKTSLADTPITPQEETDNDVVETNYLNQVGAKAPFHRALMRRAYRMKRRGKLTGEQLSILRDALNSPNARASIERTIRMEMAFSAQADQIPRTNEGRIQWDKLGDFFERIIPLIITLIEAIIKIAGTIVSYGYTCLSYVRLC